MVISIDIPSSLIINLDQTPLSYISPGKYNFNIKCAKNVPVKGIDDKSQIAASFTVSAVVDFLPMQLIYTRNTNRYVPNFDFSRDFKATYGESCSALKKSFFHSFRKPKTNIVTPKSKCL